MVDDEAILDAVERHRGDLDQAAQGARRRRQPGGGEDNITVVLFEIAGDARARRDGGAAGRRVDDDEDTLSGLDPVPTIDAPTPAEAGRRTQRRRPSAATQRRRRVPRTLIVVASLRSSSCSRPVGRRGGCRARTSSARPQDGHVAVYQGFPYDIAGSVQLYRLRLREPLLAAQLTQAERQELFDHDLRGYAFRLRADPRLRDEEIPP